MYIAIYPIILVIILLLMHMTGGCDDFKGVIIFEVLTIYGFEGIIC